MLTSDIIAALGQYFAGMQKTVTLVLQTGAHEKRAEQVEFLSSIADISDNVVFEERDAGLRSPVSFFLETEGQDTGIIFSGIPGGHEFNSLILAILHAAGGDMKLDEGIVKLIRQISTPLHFEAFISLSCHNCPDVVQALNQFALLNDNITTETLDGGLYPELVEARNIQGVPNVFLNGENFANGKVEAAELLNKLIELQPEIAQVEAAADSGDVSDVTIIGGGPAGVAAAIYSARKGLAVNLVAERFGGQVKDTMGIENLISVPSTTGPELVNNLYAHLGDYDINIKEHLKVTGIENGAVKSVTLASGEVLHARSLIIATGARWRELGVPGEKENIGNGVAYCPHCDGPFFKGRDVAVIGGGNSGIEAALDLAGIVKSVTVYEFLPDLKADQLLVDQAATRDNITIVTNAATKQILAEDGKVTGLEYENRATGEVIRQDLAGVFVQIGLIPNSQPVEGMVDMEAWGEIIINDKCETSQPGIFACGDVTTVPQKQIVVAMGEGAKAALASFEYLLMHQGQETVTDLQEVA